MQTVQRAANLWEFTDEFTRSSRHRQQNPHRGRAPAHQGTTLRPLTLPAPQEGNGASSTREFRPQVGKYLFRQNRAHKPGIKLATATLYFVKPRLFYARLRRTSNSSRGARNSRSFSTSGRARTSRSISDTGRAITASETDTYIIALSPKNDC